MKKKSGIRLWAVLFWLVVWQLGSMAIGQELFLVSPVKVLVQLARLGGTGAFWISVGSSLLRIVGGFLAAVAVGILLAAFSVRFKVLRELLAPLMLTIRTIPVASFIILALIWFSSRNLAVLISFLMVLPLIYTNVQSGILATDSQLLEMARVFRLPLWRRVRYIYMPQVTPYFQSGCTVALGLCWKAGIAAEVIGIPQNSIGENLQQAKIYLDTPNLFAWTLVIVLVSVGFEQVFLGLLRRLAAVLEEV